MLICAAEYCVSSIHYRLQVSQLNNTMIYNINFEDNKRLLSLHSQYQQISTQMMQ